jgi:hypothetical protein
MVVVVGDGVLWHSVVYVVLYEMLDERDTPSKNTHHCKQQHPTHFIQTFGA